MRALRWHGNKDIRVDEIPEPALQPGWVKVKNAWAGICGSDLHEYLIGPKNAPLTPHVLTGEKLPSIIGHEFSGVVCELGEGVTDLKIGQKVAVFPVITDQTCNYCEEELWGMCEKWGFMGYSGYGGGMAEYTCAERKAIHKIPDNMPLDVAALVEPLAVAWHAVQLRKPAATDTAFVVGAGPIGIAVILCLRAHGVGKILVSEPSPARAAHAKDAGADDVFDPIKEDAVSLLRKANNGRGAELVYECAGVQASVQSAFEAVGGKGTVVEIAKFEESILIQPNVLNRKSATYMQSNVYTREEFQDVIDAIASGKIKNPEKMITAKVPLRNAVVGGFEALLAGKDKHVKILINSEE